MTTTTAHPAGTRDPSAGRWRSLDVFRGAAIAAMIVVNNPGAPDVAFGFLRHSAWHGWTFADTIFPAFLWIVGLSATLSTQRRMQRGDTRSQLLVHAVRRSALLVLCGLILEGFPKYELATLQVTGVLQKIAVTYLLAEMLLLYARERGLVPGIVGAFAAYLAFMLGWALPGCGDPWSAACNAAVRLDHIVLAGHVWVTPTGNDSDGAVGTLAGTSSVLLGMLAARFVADGSAAAPARLRALVLYGVALVVGGLVASLVVPINKILWTPSFALLMGGFATLAYAACWWIFDVRRRLPGTNFLEIFGMNALAAYMLSRLGVDLLKLHVAGRSLYRDVFLRLGPPSIASLAFASMTVCATFLAVWAMYRRRIFVKL